MMFFVHIYCSTIVCSISRNAFPLYPVFSVLGKTARLCNVTAGSLPVELWMTCGWVHSQGSCLLVKINSGHYQLHYMNPL